MSADYQQVALGRPRKIHIVGIGGAGMSAIAEVLIGTGHTVTGSDLRQSAVVERLIERGIAVSIGHDANNIGAVDIVAHSSAVRPDNPELVRAAELKISVLRRAEILSLITKEWRTVAVAGTHGKTTTSAMLTFALRYASLDPAFIVGGDLRDLDRGAAVGKGEFLVVEADESDGTFIELSAEAVIVTNVEPDHLEHYGGFDQLRAAFVQFVRQASGPKLICLDDPGAAELVDDIGDQSGVTTYGTSQQADWRITNPLPTPSGIAFALTNDGESVTVNLRQPGMHNARNATAAIATAVALGASLEVAAEALCQFGGVGRRFEPRGKIGDITLIDDYAHLPTEVQAALAAAKSLSPKRVVAAFQPHRYSRTEQLWNTFGDSFNDADILFVTGIYSSGEEPRPGITGELIAKVVRKAHPGKDVRYVETLSDLAAEVANELEQGDLCITLGAGDLTTIPDQILEHLERQLSSDEPQAGAKG